MEKILIFGGTTEGRRLSELLSQAGVFHTVSVATEYGKICMEENSCLSLVQGRKTEEEIHQWILEEDFTLLIDATHPYAELISKNLREACFGTDCEYLRLLRETRLKDRQNEKGDQEICFFSSDSSCAEALKKTEGNILLTTGTKSLKDYAVEGLRDRLYVRVLPGLESLKLCEEAGIRGKQILALQGPFSEELNLAMLRQYQIRTLVTKWSGRAGGLPEKLSASKKAGVSVYGIGQASRESGRSFSEITEILSKKLRLEFPKKTKLHVTLSGIGMGNPALMTEEVRTSIKDADILLGAKRVLECAEGLSERAFEKKSIYQAEEIKNYLKEAGERYTEYGELRICILFSGDSGFYSGASNLEKLLSEEFRSGRLEGRLSVLPGISSVSALAARLRESWQDAEIFSIHGKSPESFLPKLLDLVKHNKKSYVLLSGAKDLRVLPDWLKDAGLRDTELIAGYELSSEREKLYYMKNHLYYRYSEGRLEEEVSPDHLPDGLYIVRIYNPKAEKRRLSYGIPDSEFLRDQVPMTKEEVREVILSKLRLSEDAVFYDIGSGSGSIAVEAAKLSPRISVYAIERKENALSLMERNKEKFSAGNMKIIAGTAPEVLRGLPIPTHAFIGGSSGKLVEILECLYQKNPRMRVVISAVSLETISELREIPDCFSISEEELVQLQLSRAEKLGNYHLMRAQNPVMLYSFSFR